MSGENTGKNILVTGAGGGLGKAVAEALAHRGHRVTGTVRNAVRARELEQASAARGAAVRYVALELSSPDAVAALASEATRGGGPDVLVHNAGFGVFGAVEETPMEAVRRQFEVNFFGPLALTRLLLPALRERRGQIVWIGSLAGRIALPFQAHYSATKAAIASVSDALRIELAPFGVRVTCVEPGDFATGFTDARNVYSSGESVYRQALERCLAAVDSQERGGPKPDWVGRVVARLVGTARPPARVPVGQGARTMCALLRLLPDVLRERGVRAHYRQ